MKPKPERIGEHLAELRRRRGWTLEKVSRMTGVGVSTLWKVENRQNGPSMKTLLKISHGMGINFEELLRPQAPEQAAGRRAVSRADQGLKFSTTHYGYDVFANELSQKQMVPVVITVRARSIKEFEHLNSHSGEEFVYVMSGRVEMHTSTYSPLRLDKGESVYFDCSTPHAFITLSKAPAQMLSVSLGRFPADWIE